MLMNFKHVLTKFNKLYQKNQVPIGVESIHLIASSTVASSTIASSPSLN